MKNKIIIIVVCQILSMLLFISAHFLESIIELTRLWKENLFFFGINVEGFIIDITIFSAIGTEFLAIILLLTTEGK